jgi:hypothetical protein
MATMYRDKLSGVGKMLGDSLRRHIRASGRSVNSLAVESRIAQPALNRFVLGHTEINLRTASAICKQLGLDFMPRNQGELMEAIFERMIGMFYRLEAELRKDGADRPAARLRRYAETYLLPELANIRAQLGTEEGPKPAPDPQQAPPEAEGAQDAEDAEDAGAKKAAAAPPERDRKVGKPVNRLPRRSVKVPKRDPEE